MRRWLTGLVVLLWAWPVEAQQTRTVGAGRTYAKIQDCANVAVAGDTCEVYAGTYPERVSTNSHGSAGSRITFRAVGVVTMRGFDVSHAYHTIDGFDMAGYTTDNGAYVEVYYGGSYLEVLNNTMRDNDGTNNVGGVMFRATSGQVANNATIRHNLFDNLLSQGCKLYGSNHLVEGNTFVEMHQFDPFMVWGSDITIRRNVVLAAGTVGGGNHPDFFQTWSSDGQAVKRVVIEENFILTLPDQFCQLNSAEGVGAMVTNISDITFRRNVVGPFSANCNIDVPYVTFENNTFYQPASTLSGFVVGGSFTRGDAHHALFRNNVFLGGGNTPLSATSYSGFYSVDGFLLTREVMGFLITDEGVSPTISCPSYPATWASPPAPAVLNRIYMFSDSASTTTCAGGGTSRSSCAWIDTTVPADGVGDTWRPEILQPLATSLAWDMVTQGVIDGCTNGHISAAAKAFTDKSQLTLDASNEAYRDALWATLQESITYDNTLKSTFTADYNYVSGASTSTPPYIAKKSSGCVCPGNYTAGNFCEAACSLGGINGGDPGLADLTSLLGADGIPFTADDGLKPTPSSKILCGTGYGSVDIGAYSCTSGIVFAGGATVPSAPTAVTITGTTTPTLQWTQTSGDATEYVVWLDGARTFGMDLPTPTGTTYQSPLPTNVTSGAHTIRVAACNTGGCAVSAAVTIVKL